MTWKDCGNNEWSSHPFRITGSHEQGGYRYRLYHLGRFLVDEPIAEDARIWADLCRMRSVNYYFPAVERAEGVCDVPEGYVGVGCTQALPEVPEQRSVAEVDTTPDRLAAA